MNRTRPEPPVLQNQRRGTAPLEFVLALPLFVLLFLALYAVAGAVRYRMAAIERTRMTTWKALPSTLTFEQLTLQRPVLDGEKKDTTRIPYDFGGRLNGRVDATSSTMSIAGTWDHRTVPFRRRVPRYQGHIEPANTIAESWPSARGIGWVQRAASVGMRRLQAKVALW